MATKKRAPRTMAAIAAAAFVCAAPAAAQSPPPAFQIDTTGATRAITQTDATGPSINAGSSHDGADNVGSDNRGSDRGGANDGSAAPPSYVPSCALSPNTLGVSRVVEIDAAGGPQLGGSHGGRVDFLEPGEVLLTFDDGPMRAYTRRVLKALADECTLATFFMVGRMAAADPAMVREVAAAGHTVGSHTWSHKNLGAVNAAVMRRDFEMGVAAVNKANDNAAAPFFRFPYLSAGHAGRALVKARNFATFWIDVDSKDYLSKSPSDVHRRVMSQLAVTGKGIVLFHDIQPSTVKALPGLLKDMREKGFRIVHAVPVTPAEAVADYDSDVSKAFAAKSKKSNDNTLANRSVVWSTSPGGADDLAQPSAAGSDLPWSANTPKSKPVRRAARKPPPAPVEQLPWQNQIFNY